MIRIKAFAVAVLVGTGFLGFGIFVAATVFNYMEQRQCRAFGGVVLPLSGFDWKCQPPETSQRLQELLDP